jgi:L-asparaginase
MKHILLIGTGGTIACKPSVDGLSPALECEDLLRNIDDLSSVCKVDFYQLFNIDSSNMTYSHWLRLALLIKEKYEDYDGFVITHGTDTMAYGASALSYMIQNSSKPIVMTGSQKSIYMKDNDARANLFDALLYASDDKAYGVSIVFDGKVILGTRAKKIRSKSYNAFTSVNYPEIARINDHKVIQYIPKFFYGDVRFYLDFDTNVTVLKIIPNDDMTLLRYALDKYDCIILEGFGVGGIPDSYDELYSLLKDKIIVVATQVQYEGSDLNVYSIGRKLKKEYKFLESFDMTSESILAKMMWILSQTKKKEEIQRLLYTPIYHDILL